MFRNNCGQCHGAGGQGAIGGFPNLLDDSWLWGGTIEDIHQTILHGIRYEPDPDTRFSQMPAFGEILEPAEIDGLVQYVLSLSGADHDAEVAAAHAQSFLDNCSSCHGEAGEGMQEMGAPNLSDSIWLYGGDPATIRYSIQNARYGIMPSFSWEGPAAARGHPQGRGLRPQPRRRPIGRRLGSGSVPPVADQPLEVGVLGPDVAQQVRVEAGERIAGARVVRADGSTREAGRRRRPAASRSGRRGATWRAGARRRIRGSHTWS